jgi:hypothetical protein
MKGSAEFTIFGNNLTNLLYIRRKWHYGYIQYMRLSKLMKKLLLFVFFACLTIGIFSCNKKTAIQDSAKPTTQSENSASHEMDIFNDCPMEGNAVKKDVRELNLLKNRYNFPMPEDINHSITLQKIIDPGNDAMRWNTSQAAEIIGYVYDVKPGGVETCNCKTKDIEKRDTHIELVLDPMQTGAPQRVVVEVTPRFRQIMKDKNINWTTRGIRDTFLGRWVKVQGWMFFDSEHDDEAENTNPGRERNWRGTAWEIHPITAMEVVQRPKLPI